MILKLVERKTGKNGEYLAVTLNDGSKASCFSNYNYLWAQIENAFKEKQDVVLQTQVNGKFVNIIGLEGVEPPPQTYASKGARSGAIGAAMDRKEKSISGFVEKKENSMRRFAILRDSAMFAALSWEGEDGEKRVDMLKKAHQKWQEYFETIY